MNKPDIILAFDEKSKLQNLTKFMSLANENSDAYT